MGPKDQIRVFVFPDISLASFAGFSARVSLGCTLGLRPSRKWGQLCSNTLSSRHLYKQALPYHRSLSILCSRSVLPVAPLAFALSTVVSVQSSIPPGSLPCLPYVGTGPSNVCPWFPVHHVYVYLINVLSTPLSLHKSGIPLSLSSILSFISRLLRPHTDGQEEGRQGERKPEADVRHQQLDPVAWLPCTHCLS